MCRVSSPGSGDEALGSDHGESRLLRATRQGDLNIELHTKVPVICDIDAEVGHLGPECLVVTLVEPKLIACRRVDELLLL
jgi:hypothetical protein